MVGHSRHGTGLGGSLAGRAGQGRAQHSQGLIAQTLKKLSEEELIAFPQPAFSCSVVFLFLD